ncbi:MAG: hypothetical protein KA118_18245 [Verrucomicrobia bacterium]|nr:hypothetical protein [Verrucomicrobiota bacterium]
MNNTLPTIDLILENQAQPIPTKLHFCARRIENGRVAFSTYTDSREEYSTRPDFEVHSVVIGILPTEPGVFCLTGVDFIDEGTGWREVREGHDFVVVSNPTKNTLLGKLITREWDYFCGNAPMP